MIRPLWQRALIGALIAALILLILFPLYYIVIMSIHPAHMSIGFTFPERISWEHWKYVLGLPYWDVATNMTRTPDYPILRWIFNSVKISAITSVLLVLLCTSSAYAISRFRFFARRSMLVTLMIAQMFPAMMGMVALFLMMDFIGGYVPWLQIGTHSALIFVYLGGTPFFTWLIKGYFDSIPRSIEEAALIDGCSRWQTFWRILLPQSLPILAVVAIIQFIMTFSDWVLPAIFIKDPNQLTFAVGLRFFIQGQYMSRWGQFAAASILGAVPISVIFFAVQKYIISGLSAGGAKE